MYDLSMKCNKIHLMFVDTKRTYIWVELRGKERKKEKRDDIDWRETSQYVYIDSKPGQLSLRQLKTTNGIFFSARPTPSKFCETNQVRTE